MNDKVTSIVFIFLFAMLCTTSCKTSKDTFDPYTSYFPTTIEPGYNSDEKLTNGIKGRKLIQTNREDIGNLLSKAPSGRSSIIVIDTCIDQMGKVSNLRINKDLSSQGLSPKLLKGVLELVSGYQFEANAAAPPQECGLTRIKLDRQ